VVLLRLVVVLPGELGGRDTQTHANDSVDRINTLMSFIVKLTNCRY
jgi:hypothetical protein